LKTGALPFESPQAFDQCVDIEVIVVGVGDFVLDLPDLEIQIEDFALEHFEANDVHVCSSFSAVINPAGLIPGRV
jgi:hypothetical protein